MSPNELLPRLDAIASSFLSFATLQIAYSTVLGGNGFDGAVDIAVRPDGAAYVLGNTTSRDFPVPGGFQQQLRGSSDMFVAVLNPSGGLHRATYLGGGDADDPGDIQLAEVAPGVPRVNAFGDAVVVSGRSRSPDYPTLNAPQPNRRGERDAVVTMFDRETLQPVFSSYAGQDGIDAPLTFALNQARGDIYVLLRQEENFQAWLAHFRPRPPAVPAAAGGVSGASAHPPAFELVTGLLAGEDAFPPHLEQWIRDKVSTYGLFLEFFYPDIVKFLLPEPPAPGGLQGPIVVDADDRQPVASTVLTSSVFAMMAPGCLPVAPATDCRDRNTVIFFNQDRKYVGHVNYSGQGGSATVAERVAVDRQNRYHFIGSTNDRMLPLVNPIQGSHRGAAEGFILTLDPVAETTSFLSYLGGTSHDYLTDIAVDAAGNRWIVGYTLSSDFPVTRSGVQPDMKGRTDAFVVKIVP